MKKVRNSLNYHPTDKGEKNKRPSLTEPDQAMSIQEILLRHTRGLPIDNQKVPIYEGEDSDMPDPRTLDLVDRQEMAENARQELQDLTNKLNEPRKKQKVLPEQSALLLSDDKKDSQDPQKHPKKTPPEGPPVGPAEQNQH